SKDNYGKTPLQVAIENRNKEIVEFLISKGANIESKYQNGNTAFDVIMKMGDKRLTEVLLWFGNVSENVLKNYRNSEIVEKFIENPSKFRKELKLFPKNKGILIILIGVN